MPPKLVKLDNARPRRKAGASPVPPKERKGKAVLTPEPTPHIPYASLRDRPHMAYPADRMAREELCRALSPWARKRVLGA